MPGCGGGGHKAKTATTPGTPATTPAATTPAATTPAPVPPRRSSEGRLSVGIGDQNAAMFSNPLFRALHVRRARLVAGWDSAEVPAERKIVTAWLDGARAAGVEPLVAFNHSRERPTALPSVAEYTRAVRAFHERWPQVRTFSSWNEINHRSQPTADNPARAAAYYVALRGVCPGCTVTAADVLDQAGMVGYLRRFLAALPGPAPRLWGLHNYSDTNRFRDRGTRRLLRAVPGEVWMTETGGLYSFGRGFPPDAQRQARATRYAFHLAGSSRRITRFYLYNWTGAPPGARFDAGLIGPDGRARPAYRVVKQRLN